MDTKQSVPGLAPEKEPTEQEPTAVPADATQPEIALAIPERPKTPEVPEKPEVTSTPETTPTPEEPPNTKRDAWIQERTELTIRQQELLVTSGKAGAHLAEWTAALGGDTAMAQQWVETALKLKGMSEEQAAERAAEMAKLEKSELFSTLNEQLTAAFAEQKLPPETIARYSQEVHRALHEVVASGHLKTQDIERLLAGGIRIHATEKGDPKHYEAVASITLDDEHRPVLNLYRAFFDRRKDENKQDTLYAHNDQAHLMRHELGHAISQQIFAERLTGELKKSILDAVDNANADLGEIPPEFHSIVLLLRDPMKAKGLEKRSDGHLANRFEALAEEKDPAKRLDFRRVMIREIIAERVANYLASDGTAENYYTLRAINNQESREFSDPAAEKALFDAISAGFRGKENWQDEYAENEWDWFDDIDYELYEPEDMSLYAPSSTPSDNYGQSAGQGPLGKFFDFLTGTGEYKNKSVPSTSIPEALKKAA